MNMTLLLGLGGIGGEIITRVREALPESAAVSAAVLDCMPPRRETAGVSFLSLERRGRVGSLANAYPQLRASSWLPNTPLLWERSFEQIPHSRMMTRLRLAAAWEDGAFHGWLESLDADIPCDVQEITVVITTTVAGNTGSGTFLQMAALMRTFFAMRNRSVTVYGLLLLPDALRSLAVNSPSQRQRLEENTYASLRELQALTEQNAAARRGERIAAPLSIDGFYNAADPHAQPLFDFVFLLGEGLRGEDAPAKLREMTEQIILGKFFSDMQPALRSFEMAMWRTNALCVGSLGVAGLRFPREERFRRDVDRLLGEILTVADEPDDARAAHGIYTKDEAVSLAKGQMAGCETLINDTLQAAFAEQFGAERPPLTTVEALRERIAADELRLETAAIELPRQASAIGRMLVDQSLPDDVGTLRREDPLSLFAIFSHETQGDARYADLAAVRWYLEALKEALKALREREVDRPTGRMQRAYGPPPHIPESCHRLSEGEMLEHKPLFLREARFAGDFSAWHEARYREQTDKLFDVLYKKVFRCFVETYERRLEMCHKRFVSLISFPKPVPAVGESSFGVWESVKTPDAEGVDVRAMGEQLARDLLFAACGGDRGNRETVPLSEESSRIFSLEKARRSIESLCRTAWNILYHPCDLFDALCQESDATAPAKEGLNACLARRMADVHRRLRALPKRAEVTLTWLGDASQLSETAVYCLPNATRGYAASLFLPQVFGNSWQSFLSPRASEDEVLCLRQQMAAVAGNAYLPFVPSKENFSYCCYRNCIEQIRKEASEESSLASPHLDKTWDRLLWETEA